MSYIICSRYYLYILITIIILYICYLLIISVFMDKELILKGKERLLTGD